MSAPILRVIKDGCKVYLEVPGAPSEKLPLWNPELFDRATVRIGPQATYRGCPVEELIVEPADVWLAKQRAFRKELEDLDG